MDTEHLKQAVASLNKSRDMFGVIEPQEFKSDFLKDLTPDDWRAVAKMAPCQGLYKNSDCFVDYGDHLSFHNDMRAAQAVDSTPFFKLAFVGTQGELTPSAIVNSLAPGVAFAAAGGWMYPVLEGGIVAMGSTAVLAGAAAGGFAGLGILTAEIVGATAYVKHLASWDLKNAETVDVNFPPKAKP